MPPEKAARAGRVLRFLPPPEHVPQPFDRMPQLEFSSGMRCKSRVEWLPRSMLRRYWLQQRRATLLKPRHVRTSAAAMTSFDA
jgi:hypothetical protein